MAIESFPQSMEQGDTESSQSLTTGTTLESLRETLAMLNEMESLQMYPEAASKPASKPVAANRQAVNAIKGRAVSADPEQFEMEAPAYSKMAAAYGHPVSADPVDFDFQDDAEDDFLAFLAIGRKIRVLKTWVARMENSWLEIAPFGINELPELSHEDLPEDQSLMPIGSTMADIDCLVDCLGTTFHPREPPWKDMNVRMSSSSPAMPTASSSASRLGPVRASEGAWPAFDGHEAFVDRKRPAFDGHEAFVDGSFRNITDSGPQQTQMAPQSTLIGQGQVHADNSQLRPRHRSMEELPPVSAPQELPPAFAGQRLNKTQFSSAPSRSGFVVSPKSPSELNTGSCSSPLEAKFPLGRQPVVRNQTEWFQSDQMLQEDPMATLMTIGGTMHAAGQCKPCLFWYEGNCIKGRNCMFCHMVHNTVEVRRVRPSKKTRERLKKQREDLAGGSGSSQDQSPDGAQVQ